MFEIYTQTHVVKIKKKNIYTTLNLCIFLEDDANNKQIINSKQNTKKYMNVIFKYLHFFIVVVCENTTNRFCTVESNK